MGKRAGCTDFGNDENADDIRDGNLWGLRWQCRGCSRRCFAKGSNLLSARLFPKIFEFVLIVLIIFALTAETKIA